MKIEFYQDKTGCFKSGTMFRELGSKSWIPIESLDINKQKILYMLFQDNHDTQKIIDYHRQRGVTDMTMLLKLVINKKFSGLDPQLDIDEDKVCFD